MKTARHRKQKAESRKQKAECGMRNAVSRITHHTPRGFTLIELLVVISVIALLAALTFPAVGAARLAMMRARARSEMAQIETAIERYHDKLGYYPPDNAPNWAPNQLYYELLGTINSGGVYHTLDDSAQIKTAEIPNVFGPTVTGFMNCSQGGDDGTPGAVAFLKGLKPAQFMPVTNGISSASFTVLGTSLDGPQYFSNLGAKLNPWRYNASSPRYNPKSFDLWIDVMAGSKTNRISNWSDRPLIVSTPY
jgi:prepilin-type N-terminal cleavage/methylation domain-containing protein